MYPEILTGAHWLNNSDHDHRFTLSIHETVMSEQIPKFSIVTHCLNQGEFLEECIDSVLSQNYPSLEFAILDGGSTDNSVSIIKKHEKHLAFWRSQPDGNPHEAVTRALAGTNGDIMAWIDAGDKYLEDAFWFCAYAFAEFPEVDWLTGRYTYWDAQGHLSRNIPLLRWSRRRLLDLKPDTQATFIQQASTFWRRRLWERAGGYIDGAFGSAADFELWARYLRHARLFTLDTIIGGPRSREGSHVARNRDRYIKEAATIIAREQRLIAQADHAEFLSEPVPITLDPEAVKDYRNEHGTEPVLMTEDLSGRHDSEPAVTVPSSGDAKSTSAVVTLATSIAPSNLEKQRAAVDSWIACGFRVISLNVASEIEKLRNVFHDVEFIPVTRDGSNLAGKPLVYFDDILTHLGKLGGNIFGIVNSDIYLMPDRIGVAMMMKEARGSMVFGSRADVISLAQLMGPMYTMGFDYFFFDRALLTCFPQSSFMLGMPWWDYWAPLLPLLRGFQVKYLGSPFGYHVEHKLNYQNENIARFGRDFAETLLAHFLKPIRDSFPSIKPQLSYQLDLHGLPAQVVQFLRASSTHVRIPRLEICAMNARGEAYLASGEANWAETWFRKALAKDKGFLPAYNNLAVLYWNLGRADDAAEQLRIALNLLPTDRIALLNYGTVLASLGKTLDVQNLYINYLTHYPDDSEVLQRLEILKTADTKTITKSEMLCRVSVCVKTPA